MNEAGQPQPDGAEQLPARQRRNRRDQKRVRGRSVAEVNQNPCGQAGTADDQQRHRLTPGKKFRPRTLNENLVAARFFQALARHADKVSRAPGSGIDLHGTLPGGMHT